MQYRILIVDDAFMNRELLKEMLKEKYDILEAENGIQAMDILEKEHIDGVLLDLVMPEMNGFEVLEEMKKRKLMAKIPVIIISGETSTENENKCFEYGVFDFIGRPFKMSVVQRRVQNMVSIYGYKNLLEEKVRDQTSVLRMAYDKLKKQAAELEKRNRDIIDMLGTIVEYRNLESGEHIQRVKGYTEILARHFSEMYPEYELTEDEIKNIVDASALHDLGKIAIPDKILLKPGRLTKDEFEYMKSHTLRGCEILDSMHVDLDPEMRKTSYDIIRSHHERYDGNGYPDGLKGDEIPISAQLVSLADVYDALVSERCYKNAFSMEKAFYMIIQGECGVFSPRLMKVFRQVREEFEALAQKEFA